MKVFVMKELTTDQMLLTTGGDEDGAVFKCVLSSTGYFLAAAGFVVCFLSVPALLPWMVACASVVVSAEGVRNNC